MTGMTAGELRACAAIVEVHGPRQSAPRLSALLITEAEAAEAMQPPTSEEEVESNVVPDPR